MDIEGKIMSETCILYSLNSYMSVDLIRKIRTNSFSWRQVFPAKITNKYRVSFHDRAIERKQYTGFYLKWGCLNKIKNIFPPRAVVDLQTVYKTGFLNSIGQPHFPSIKYWSGYKSTGLDTKVLGRICTKLMSPELLRQLVNKSQNKTNTNGHIRW